MPENRSLALVLWLGLGGWLLYLLSPILTPFIVAALLAYLGDPLVDRLEKWRLPRTGAVVLVFSILFGAITLLLLILIPRLGTQISHLALKLPVYLEWARAHLLPYVLNWVPVAEGSFDLSALGKALGSHWQTAGQVLAGVWGSLSSSGLAFVAWLANLVLIPVLTFYLLRDWDELVAAINALLPRRHEPLWSRLAREADEVLGAFLRGQVLVMLALGVIYTTGLWLIGLDFSLLIGTLAGLVSFVPYLGLIIGVLLAGFASVLQFEGIGMLHWVVVVFVVGQALEGSVLTPRLVGERIGLHPVAVIFAVMAGAQLYGFFGILMALPVAAVGMVLLRHLVRSYRASPAYRRPGE